MYNINEIPGLWWNTNVVGNLSSRTLTKHIRQNEKLLIDAQDKIYDYTMKKNRLGWTFEGLLRSVGLVAGTVLGGPAGAVGMAAIGTGLGRGIGQHLGNRIYGRSLHDLETIMDDYKYRQMSNQYALQSARGRTNVLNELYTQAVEEEREVSQLVEEQT